MFKILFINFKTTINPLYAKIDFFMKKNCILPKQTKINNKFGAILNSLIKN